MLLCCNETRDVGNVSHQVCAALVRDLSELLEVNHARVGRCTAQDHLWAEDQGLFLELIEVNQASFWVHAVWQGLEVDRCGRDALLGSVVAMCQ
eukprot:854127-Amphidinium_carterae.1